MEPDESPAGELPATIAQTTAASDEPRSALSIAISLWRAGRRINLALAAELMEQGYDVPTLERFHRT